MTIYDDDHNDDDGVNINKLQRSEIDSITHKCGSTHRSIKSCSVEYFISSMSITSSLALLVYFRYSVSYCLVQ